MNKFKNNGYYWAQIKSDFDESLVWVIVQYKESLESFIYGAYRIDVINVDYNEIIRK